MDTYGHVIKFERIRQNIKQAQLSEGICSPAYLSKIESNSIVPSEQVQDGLFRRLNISTYPTSLSEDDFLRRVRLIYFEAIMYKDREKTSLILKELENTDCLFLNKSNFFTFQLMMLRLNLIVTEHKNPVPDILTALSSMTKEFDDYQNFIYKLNLGFYYIFKEDYAHAMNSLETAFDYKENLICEQWEIADLEYVLGIIYLYQHKNLLAIQYSKSAIFYFEKKFFYTRVIESCIVLAIAYRRAEKYTETIKTLQLAKKVSIELKLKENFPIIFYNLGTVLLEQGEIILAIENFKECIALTDDKFSQGTCLCSIMIAYAKINDTNAVVSWSKKGIELCENTTDKKLENIVHHFYCYLARYTNSNDIEEIIKTAILYFEKKKDYHYSHKYSLQLAQYYLANKKYKNAATYFSLTNEFLAKKENRNYSEDI